MKLRTIQILSFLILILSGLSSLTAQPSWSVNPADYQFTSTITGYVSINGTETGTPNCLLAAFVGTECRGVVNTNFVAGTNRWVVFLTIHSNQVMGEKVSFKFYNAPIDFIHEVENSVDFVVNMSLGSLTNLYEFIALPAEDNTQLSVTPGHENIILNLAGNRITVAANSTTAQLDTAITPPLDSQNNVTGAYLIRYTNSGLPVTIDSNTLATEEMEVYVTAQDGSTRLYEIFMGSADASLNGITLSDGSLDPDFNAAGLYYDVYLPFGSDVPQVSGSLNDSNASINLIQADAIPGTAYLVVTAEDGVTRQTYRVYFFYMANDDATLNLLDIANHSLDPAFSADIRDYLVQLPYGTTDLPEISYSATDTNATMVVTSPTTLPGNWSVEVTAEDGTTKLNYVIDFQWLPNENALLSSLSVEGYSLDPAFSSGTTNYSVLLPPGTTNVPEVLATAQDTQASVEFFPPDNVPGTYKVVVTAMDGATQSKYYIVFGWSGNTDPSLKDLLVYGASISDFSPDTKTYHYKIPEGEIRFPEIEALCNDPQARVVIAQVTLIPGMAVVESYAENFSIFSTYWISIENSPWDACLRDLQLDGVTFMDFDPWEFNYQVELPSGTVEPPQITATANSSGAGLVVEQASGPNETALVQVISSDGTMSRTYSILYTVSTGIGNLPLKSFDIVVYPNPAQGSLITASLKTSETQDQFKSTTKLLEIRILNTNGVEVMLQRFKGIPATGLPIDINGLKPGIYYLEFLFTNKKIIKQLVVLRR